VGARPMDSHLILVLGYGAVFVSTMAWAGHCFWLREGAPLGRIARAIGGLSALLLAVGLAAHGFQAGYWPFHTSFEVLNVGLLGLLLAALTLLSTQRHGLLLALSSLLASLVAVYGLVSGGLAGKATWAVDSFWRSAYVILSAFGGGAMGVTGVAALAGGRERGEDSALAVTQRALAWSLLALSAGLATGAWWFHRLLGRYWGDGRWAGMVVVVLLGAAAWHARQVWMGRGWRSILVGVVLVLAGGYVVLGIGVGG
jgi:hypothetical protein